MHHAINEYQLRMDIKRFLRPAYYIVIYMVLLKCRQNVANKLFISRYFNPVMPLHTGSVNGQVSTERSHKSNGGRGKLFLSVEVQNLHTILA